MASVSASSFRDALSLRYSWQLPDLSSKCACSKPFSVDHAMICHKGGLPTLRHNEVRDLTAALLAETCKGVPAEPPLQALDDEEFNFRSSNCDDEARIDIKVSDLWSKGRDAFFDVSVVYPIAPSYRQKELKAIYKQHEGEKKRSYGERVLEIERASFMPLVFSSMGGMARECTIFFKRLADILAEKKKICFSKMMFLIRCTIAFALLRSSIRTIRGSRSLHHLIAPFDFTLMHAEAQVMG